MLESLLRFVAGAFTVILYALVVVFVIFALVFIIYRNVNRHKVNKAINYPAANAREPARENANDSAIVREAPYKSCAKFGSARRDIISEYYSSAQTRDMPEQNKSQPIKPPEDILKNHADLKIDALFVRKDQWYENEYSFLRRCDNGYRAFYIRRIEVEGMYYTPKEGFDFPECPDEQYILDILKGKEEFHDCRIYDCLLNEYDLKYLATQLKQNNVPRAGNVILPKRTSDHTSNCDITAAYWVNGKKTPFERNAAYNMLKAICESAKYGGVRAADYAQTR